ncbi:MAG: hypothetical protein N4A32_05970 [Marinifilaceae bacterium]|nr:hypothetical protein [Marinifilaceae bacterium]
MKIVIQNGLINSLTKWQIRAKDRTLRNFMVIGTSVYDIEENLSNQNIEIISGIFRKTLECEFQADNDEIVIVQRNKFYKVCELLIMIFFLVLMLLSTLLVSNYLYYLRIAAAAAFTCLLIIYSFPRYFKVWKVKKFKV